MSNSNTNWIQILTFIILIVGAVISNAVLVFKSHSDMRLSISELKMELVSTQLLMKHRITTGGWSRQQMQEFINDLRTTSDHKIPNLRPYINVSRN